MPDDWKTVQFFVTPLGVYEVEIGSEARYRCTCRREMCKHIRFVKAKAAENGGSYPVKIAHGVSEREIARARKSSRKFRELILKYAVPEVM